MQELCRKQKWLTFLLEHGCGFPA